MIPILSNTDILNISHLYNLHIDDCISHEQLATYPIKKKLIMVININASSNMGHWVALIIRNKQCFYYDSYGQPPSQYIANYIIKKCKCSKVMYNTNDVQQLEDVSCGFYCIAFIHHVSQKKTNNCNTFSTMFFNDTKKNVKVLQEYFKKYFKNV